MDLNRLRWRLRGAWQWPTFVLVTVVEAVMLVELPVWGDGPEGGVIAAGLLAACLNLFMVAAVAPVVGLLARRRRKDVPRQIAADYAGTVLLGALFAGLLIGGVTHRDERQADARGFAVTRAEIGRFVHREQPRFTDGLGALDTIQIEDDLFRGCVPGPPPERPLCVFVRTGDPREVRLDGDRIPNATYRSRNGF